MRLHSTRRPTAAPAAPILTALLLAGLPLLSACSRPAPPEPPAEASVEAALERARAAAGALGGGLKTALTSALETGDPAAAVSACSNQAPQIAADVETGSGVKVGRTALRLRNQANEPDAWEREALREFAARLGAGETPDGMEAFRLIPEGKGAAATWGVRWMSPILLQPMCETCHGASVDPALLTEIRARYPNDRATGFSAGDLRGAFTATVAIESAATPIRATD